MHIAKTSVTFHVVRQCMVLLRLMFADNCAGFHVACQILEILFDPLSSESDPYTER